MNYSGARPTRYHMKFFDSDPKGSGACLAVVAGQTTIFTSAVSAHLGGGGGFDIFNCFGFKAFLPIQINLIILHYS